MSISASQFENLLDDTMIRELDLTVVDPVMAEGTFTAGVRQQNDQTGYTLGGEVPVTHKDTVGLTCEAGDFDIGCDGTWIRDVGKESRLFVTFGHKSEAGTHGNLNYEKRWD